MSELESTMEERQRQIQVRVLAECSRLGRLRGEQRRRADDLAREVAECRGNIERVRESYAHRGRSGSGEELGVRLPVLGRPQAMPRPSQVPVVPSPYGAPLR